MQDLYLYRITRRSTMTSYLTCDTTFSDFSTSTYCTPGKEGGHVTAINGEAGADEVADRLQYEPRNIGQVMIEQRTKWQGGGYGHAR